ncbi:Stf0 family sulfotransferase [Rhizobacter sp. P5_C2]
MTTPTPLAYVICSYPRSGSNYLCELLASTGTLGRPQDWFNGAGIRLRGDADYPLEPHAQLQQLLLRGGTGNGVHGMKMFCASFDRIAGLDWPSALPQLHWIHLERQDLLGQAISDVRSTQTGQYRSTAPVQADPRFDHRAICDSLARTARDAGRWKFFFARNGLEPLQLNYEDVAARPQAAVDAVARFIGLEGAHPIQPQRVTLDVQRDALSDEWRRRFLAREKDVSRLEPLPAAATLWARRQFSRLAQLARPKG